MKLITFLLFLSPLAAFSQAFTYNQGGPVEKNYYSEIPFENIKGKLFVNVEFSGKKHRFLFDTGAPVTITKELAAELNAKTINKTVVRDAYLHTDSTTIVQLNGIKLGDITFNQIPAIAATPPFYACYLIEGSIGANLMRNSIVSIDNNRHVIIFTDQKKKLNLNAKNSASLQFKQSIQSDPMIQIVMRNNLKLNIPFDTGDDSFFRIDEKSITDLKPYALFDTLAKGYGADQLSFGGLQSAANKFLFKIAPFTVGDGLFNNVTVVSNKDAIPAMGSKLLDYGVVTLDYINSKFYFDAYNKVNDVTEKHWPVQPTFANNKFVIGLVWERAKDQLKQGEQILAINDKDYSNATLCELIAAGPALHDVDKATLTIKNAEGQIRKVVITKE